MNTNLSNLATADYLQVDLGSVSTIAGFDTAGRNGSNQFVRDFLVYYSSDGVSFTPDTNVYTNAYAITTTTLVSPITARYIRIYPQTYSSFPGLRIGDFQVVGTTDLSATGANANLEAALGTEHKYVGLSVSGAIGGSVYSDNVSTNTPTENCNTTLATAASTRSNPLARIAGNSGYATLYAREDNAWSPVSTP